MILLKDKYKSTFLHSLEQNHLEILKEQEPDFFNTYFEQK